MDNVNVKIQDYVRLVSKLIKHSY